MHYGDMTDSTNLIRLMQQIRPTGSTTSPPRAMSASASRKPGIHRQCRRHRRARLLGVRILGIEKETRFYQASTSELYGLVGEVPQKETTPFYRGRHPAHIRRI
jgi:GDPmannose 4,6-dehydratase